MNTVGLQFDFTVPVTNEAVRLTLDFGQDNTGRAVLFRIINGLSGEVITPPGELTTPVSPAGGGIASFDSGLIPLQPGNFRLQLASNSGADFRGAIVDNITLVSVVPEPASLGLVALGGLGLLARRRRA